MKRRTVGPSDGRTDTAIRRYGRMMTRIGVLTVLDMGAQGRREDSSGDAIQSWAEEHGYEVVVRSVVPDETALIAGKLSRWADSGEVDVVLTTGGTGLGPRDVTPEATAAGLGRPRPGIAEALGARAAAAFPRAGLARGAAGAGGAAPSGKPPRAAGG